MMNESKVIKYFLVALAVLAIIILALTVVMEKREKNSDKDSDKNPELIEKDARDNMPDLSSLENDRKEVENLTEEEEGSLKADKEMPDLATEEKVSGKNTVPAQMPNLK